MNQTIDFFINWFTIGTKKALKVIIETKKLGARDIFVKIRGDIIDGKTDFDEKLPSERKLAKFYGVSRGTVRSALKNLETQSYIIVKSGSGAFVSFEIVEICGNDKYVKCSLDIARCDGKKSVNIWSALVDQIAYFWKIHF